MQIVVLLSACKTWTEAHVYEARTKKCVHCPRFTLHKTTKNVHSIDRITFLEL